MPAFLDRTGQLYGRLVVTARAPNSGSRVRWHCLCECGVATTVLGSSLGLSTVSCGCYGTEMRRAALVKTATTHGMTGTRAHKAWSAMWKRCTNTRDRAYPNYGGRGIAVCARWRDFSAFLADLGACPDGLELERDDVDGNYEPSNCRWASVAEQANNKRNNRVVEHEGRLLTVAQYAAATGLKYSTAYARAVTRGGAPSRALHTMAKLQLQTSSPDQLDWGDTQ